MSSSDLPKLWTTSSKFAKFVLSKSGIKNQPKLSDFFFCVEYLTRRSTFINDFFWKLWFLKMCPIFVGSVANFGRFDDDDDLVKNCLFPIDAYVVWCPIWSKNLGRSLVYVVLRTWCQMSKRQFNSKQDFTKIFI